MNNKYRQIKITFGVIIMIACNLPLNINAMELTVNPQESTYSYIDIIPYSDKIIWYYREHNGVLQKRRWNETQQRWEDPEWINVE